MRAGPNDVGGGGYHDFHDKKVLARFGEFLVARAWTHAEGALALFRQAAAWLRRERVLLPGAGPLQLPKPSDGPQLRPLRDNPEN